MMNDDYYNPNEPSVEFDWDSVDRVEANGMRFTIPEIRGRLGFVITWACDGRRRDTQLMRLYIIQAFLSGSLSDHGTQTQIATYIGVTSEAVRQQVEKFESEVLKK